MLSEEDSEAPLAWVKTLSPIVMYRTERRVKIEPTPIDREFNRLIEANLLKKAEIAGIVVGGQGFRIVPLRVKRRTARYKGGVTATWSGVFLVEGEPCLIRLALNAGLGAKNSCGFGCIEAIV